MSISTLAAHSQTSDFIQLFPAIHQALNSHVTTFLEQWQSYRKQRPAGYRYSQFANL